MAKYLVIVESPAKVKTIKKFLGKNYEVVASNGHVRDLPKSTMGFDAENDFELSDEIKEKHGYYFKYVDNQNSKRICDFIRTNM